MLAILADEKEIYKIIVTELKEIKEKFGDERRTQIVARSEEISIEDMIVDEEMAVTISHEGYIKRNPVTLYRAQRRGGKGKIGTTTKEEDFVEYLIIASMHSYILFFTTIGKVYRVKVHELPQASRAAKGKPIVNLLNLEPGERVSAFLSVREFVQGRFVVFATKKGSVKKTDLMLYSNPRASGIRAIGLEEVTRSLVCGLRMGSRSLYYRPWMASPFASRRIRSGPQGAEPMACWESGLIQATLWLVWKCSIGVQVF